MTLHPLRHTRWGTQLVSWAPWHLELSWPRTRRSRCVLHVGMHEARRRRLSGNELVSALEASLESFFVAVHFVDSIWDRWNWEHQGSYDRLVAPFLQTVLDPDLDGGKMIDARTLNSVQPVGKVGCHTTYSSWPPMFDNSFEISSSLKDLDLTFIGLRLVGVLVLTLGAFKYIEAKRSPVRTGILFLDLFTPHSL